MAVDCHGARTGDNLITKSHFSTAAGPCGSPAGCRPPRELPTAARTAARTAMQGFPPSSRVPLCTPNPKTDRRFIHLVCNPGCNPGPDPDPDADAGPDTTLAHAPYHMHMRPLYPRPPPRAPSSGSSGVLRTRACGCSATFVLLMRGMIDGCWRAWGFPSAFPSSDGGQAEKRAGLLGRVQHIISSSFADGERGLGKSRSQ